MSVGPRMLLHGRVTQILFPLHQKAVCSTAYPRYGSCLLESSTIMASIIALPAELVRDILGYLPISTLHAFGLTSKQHHALQTSSLLTLHIGVFHSRISSRMSALNVPADAAGTHDVQVVLPRCDSRSPRMIVKNQNAIIGDVVERHKYVLRELEVALWDFQERTAQSVAQIKNLKHLSIRLDHTHTRHPQLDRNFWASSPGSTVWNSLCAKHNQKGALGRLRSLRLERAGITDYQLQQILESNPNIVTLRLQRCLNITKELFEYLARGRVGGRMSTLHFTKSKSKSINDHLLKYIAELSSLKVTDACFSGVTC